jgi:hypothetical protein
MARWGRDLAIASVALTVGYLIFAPSQQTRVATPVNQMQVAPVADQMQAAFQNKRAHLAPPTKQPEIAPQNAQSAKSSATNQPSTQPATGAIRTAAAIAAMLVQESRNAYYASGRPCACPDDLMRNGRRCGGNSAYSRPGGAALYCYVSDVPLAVIQRHQARLSADMR